MRINGLAMSSCNKRHLEVLIAKAAWDSIRLSMVFMRNGDSLTLGGEQGFESCPLSLLFWRVPPAQALLQGNLLHMHAAAGLEHQRPRTRQVLREAIIEAAFCYWE